MTLLALGCGRPTEVEGGPGRLSIRWTGAETGEFVGTATAVWCGRDSLLEIFALRGDTGIGMALVVSDTVKPGQYAVVAPDVVVPWRPVATVALRWFGSAVKGYEGTSGVVSITSVDSGPTGTIDARLKLAAGVDTLRLSGTFSGIRVRSGAANCGKLSALPSPRSR